MLTKQPGRDIRFGPCHDGSEQNRHQLPSSRALQLLEIRLPHLTRTKMSPQIARIAADGVDVFYRHAGPETGPTTPPPARLPLVVLHVRPRHAPPRRQGLPHRRSRTSLASAYHDGAAAERSTRILPSRTSPKPSRPSSTRLVPEALRRLHLRRRAAPAKPWACASLSRPGSVAAVVSQNGNAYAEGLAPGFWAPLEQLWLAADHADTPAKLAQATAPLLTLEGTRMQYLEGAARPERVPPETYTLDQALLERPGNKDVQRALFLDYRTNVALYPRFHEYFRASGVPVLAARGQERPHIHRPWRWRPLRATSRSSSCGCWTRGTLRSRERGRGRGRDARVLREVWGV